MRITENLQENFPFISVLKHVDKEYVGIIINQDSQITSMYDYSFLRTEQEKAKFLAERTIIGKNWDETRSSSFLSEIQKSLTNFKLLRIHYRKENDSETSIREVEPFAIYHNTSENWVLIAWCRLRNEFRNFRIDRIEQLIRLEISFHPHKMSLEEFVEIQRKKHFGE